MGQAGEHGGDEDQGGEEEISLRISSFKLKRPPAGVGGRFVLILDGEWRVSSKAYYMLIFKAL